ncbi:rho guanine nucleotide exchange factor 40 isoform X2 [Pelodiscus sinensis]|uniref:rho guanine nucleotide exchange factor 40 isoform X2 n=1 Tax=Pelodiscus sinensis TaxID=13735 RepID=UPI003F6B9909
MEPEPVEDCVQNTLSALYPPFAATAPTLLGQVFEVVERTYREDALRYTLEFLIPAKHILARIQQEACAQYQGLVFCHEGWPLSLHEKVVVQLSSLPWQQLRPGDFYLQVAPYLARAPRLVLKCLAPDGRSLQELPVPPHAYPFLFTAEWLSGVNADRRAGRLERCLLAAGERLLRLPWTELICPQFVPPDGFPAGQPGPAPLGARSPGDGRHSGGESQELEGEYVQLLEITPPRPHAPPAAPMSQSRTLPARKGQSKGRSRRHRAWLHPKPSREETLPRNRPRSTWEGGGPGTALGQVGLLQAWDPQRPYGETRGPRVSQGDGQEQGGGAHKVAAQSLDKEGQLPGERGRGGPTLREQERGGDSGEHRGGPSFQKGQLGRDPGEQGWDPSHGEQQQGGDPGEQGGGPSLQEVQQGGDPGEKGEEQGGGPGFGEQQRDGDPGEKGEEQGGGPGLGEQQRDGDPGEKGEEQGGGPGLGEQQRDGDPGEKGEEQGGGPGLGEQQRDGDPGEKGEEQRGGPGLGEQQRDGDPGEKGEEQGGGPGFGEQQRVGDPGEKGEEQGGGPGFGEQQRDGDPGEKGEEQGGGPGLGEQQRDGDPGEKGEEQGGGSGLGEQQRDGDPGEKGEEQGGGPGFGEQQQDGDPGEKGEEQGGDPGLAEQQRDGDPGEKGEEQGGDPGLAEQQRDGDPGEKGEEQGGGPGFGEQRQDGDPGEKGEEQGGGPGLGEQRQDGDPGEKGEEQGGGPGLGEQRQDGDPGEKGEEQGGGPGLGEQRQDGDPGEKGEEQRGGPGLGEQRQDGEPGEKGEEQGGGPGLGEQQRGGDLGERQLGEDLGKQGLCLGEQQNKDPSNISPQPSVGAEGLEAWPAEGLGPGQREQSQGPAKPSSPQHMAACAEQRSLGARTRPQGGSGPGVPPRAAKGNRRRRWGGRGYRTSVDWQEPGPVARVGGALADTKEGGSPSGTGLPVPPSQEEEASADGSTPAEAADSTGPWDEAAPSSPARTEAAGTAPCVRNVVPWQQGARAGCPLETLPPITALRGQDVDWELLCSGIFQLTGGTDRTGRALLTITPPPTGKLDPSQGELSRALRYLHSLLRKEQQELGLTVLLDLRQGGALPPQPPALLPALRELQEASPAPVSCLLVLAPLEGPGELSLDQEALILSPADLPLFVHPEQLQPALGGTLPHSHGHWVETCQALERLCALCQCVIQAVQAASAELEALGLAECEAALSVRIAGHQEAMQKLLSDPRLLELQSSGGTLLAQLTPSETHSGPAARAAGLYQEVDDAIHRLVRLSNRRLAQLQQERGHQQQAQAQDGVPGSAVRLPALEDGGEPGAGHGELSDDALQELRGLAVQGPRALWDLGRYQARCQELGRFLQKRLEVALRTGPPPRRRADSASASSSPQRPGRGLGTGLASSRSMSCLLPPPGSLSPGLHRAPPRDPMENSSEEGSSPPSSSPATAFFQGPTVPPCRPPHKSPPSTQRSLSMPGPSPPHPSVLIRGLEVSSQEVVDRTCSPREHVMVVRSSAQRADAPWGGTPSTERKRRLGAQQQLVTDLIAAEQGYLCCLAESLSLEPAGQGLSPELRRECDALESTRRRLLDFHRAYFLKELRGCASHPLRAGACFLRYADQFGLYAPYVKNQQKLMAALACHPAANKTMHGSPEAPREEAALASALRRPLEQLECYRHFLEELLQETDPEQASEREALGAAQQLLHSQVRHGTDLLAMEQIRGCELDLAVQGRLLQRDELVVLHGRRKRHRHLFLFEQLLLFCKRRGAEGGLEAYVCKQAFPTADMGLTENIGESGLCFELWFRRGRLRDAYTLQAPSPAVKHQWTGAVAQLLWNQATLSKAACTRASVVVSSFSPCSPPAATSSPRPRPAPLGPLCDASPGSPAGRGPRACSLPGHLEEEEEDWALDVKHIPCVSEMVAGTRAASAQGQRSPEASGSSALRDGHAPPDLVTPL